MNRAQNCQIIVSVSAKLLKVYVILILIFFFNFN